MTDSNLLDDQARNITIEGNEIIMHVKKANLFARIMMFGFAFISFLLPISGTLGSIISGNGFHFAFLIAIFLFGLIGFYLLRSALWNTRGIETIKFKGSRIIYTAHYGWFKDRINEYHLNESFEIKAEQIGYEEEITSILLIDWGDDKIECATKINSEVLDDFLKINHDVIQQWKSDIDSDTNE